MLTLPGFSQIQDWNGFKSRKPVDWDNLRGLRWKPGSPARDVIVTKTPFVPEGKKQLWAEFKIITGIGANYITVDLTPAKKLIKDKEGTACRGKAPDSDCVREWKEQQYDEVASFIRRSTRGVFLHARVTPQGGSTISGSGDTDFANDMIAIINRLKGTWGIHKLKGIMIGEHEKSGRNMLKMAIRIVNKINQGTDDWLKDHGAVTLHGGGFGAKFQNIHWQVKDYREKTAGEQNFLVEMGTLTKGFAFAFKFFKGNLNFVPSDVTLTTEEWKIFLNEGNVTKDGKTYKFGFKLDHVERLFSDSTFNAGVSDDYKNIIFVGDDADGIVNLWKPKTLNSYWALLDIFDSRDWNGFFFGVPFSLKEKTRMLTNDRGWEDTTRITGNYTKVDLWQLWAKNVKNGRLAEDGELVDEIEQDMPVNNYLPYPNPVHEGYALININENDKVDLSVFDSLGRELFSVTRREGQTLKIDMSRLKSGFYFVKGTIGETKIGERLILK